MKKILTTIIFLLISGCSITDIPSYFGLPNTSSKQIEINKIDTRLAWSTDIGASRDYKTGVLQPVFLNGISYTIDTNGYVTAIDLKTGSKLWAYDLDMDVSSGLGVHDDKLFFGTNDGMYYGFSISKIMKPYSVFDNLDFVNILDGSTIEPDLKIQLKSEASSPAIGVGNLIFIKLDDGDTVAIDYIDNSIAWNYKGRNVSLSIKGSGAIASLNNSIYVPRDDGNLVSLITTSGKLNWLVSISPRAGRNELESLRDIEIIPVIDNGILYVGSYQGNLISVDIFNGNILWSRPMSVMSNLSIDERTLYVSDYTGHINAIDRYDGSILWKYTLPENLIPTQTFVMDRLVVSLTTNGHIVILNKLDGKMLSFKKILSEVDHQARGILSNKYLYINSKDGRLNAIKIN